MVSTKGNVSCYRATNFKISSKDVSQSTKSKVVHNGPTLRWVSYLRKSGSVLSSCVLGSSLNSSILKPVEVSRVSMWPLLSSLITYCFHFTGAIMFNDKLDLGQCERLVYQLSKTVFPFQCAHGRPSMVPLTTLDVLDSSSRSVRHHDLLKWTNLVS